MWGVFLLQVFCCVCLVGCLIGSSGFMSFWFVLEVLTLSIIPYFFLLDRMGASGRAVFYYFIVAGLSSFFLVLGTFVNQLEPLLMVVGVVLKLGVFPFLGWAFEVVKFSNWVVIWFFSILLKVPFIILVYNSVWGVSLQILVCLLCFMGFSILSLVFWVGVRSLESCWCVMMLSGCAVLVVSSCFCNGWSVFLYYAVYFFWGSLVVLYFSGLNNLLVMRGHSIFVYIFLLVPLPLSIAFLYKMAGVVLLSGVPGYVLGGWVLYSVSEQSFLMYLVLCRNKTRSSFNCFRWV